MERIKNGFDSRYYLLSDGKIYDEIDNKYLFADSGHRFRLKTVKGTTKSVQLRTLYKMVYNELFIIDNIKDLDSEKWKYIEGTDKKYLCSNMGRIKSYNRYEAKILEPYKNDKGYLRVDLFFDGIRKTMLVSRIVADIWLPKPKLEETQIHHIGDKTDNRASMLVWVSQKEHNAIHNKRKELN